jgi:hypothetical protein
MQAGREASKTTNLKANPEEMESKSEPREVPKEDVIVKPVKGRSGIRARSYLQDDAESQRN